MATIKLKHPFIHNDEQVSEIILPSRLTIRHLRAIDNVPGEIGKVAALIGEMANLPMSAVDKIDMEDFAAINEVASGFLAQFQAIGGT